VVLGGGAALYLAAISFIHWVNRDSLDDRVVFARLLTAAALILLLMSGSALAPTLFVGLVALAMLGLTTFETLYAGRPARDIRSDAAPAATYFPARLLLRRRRISKALRAKTTRATMP
jgi:O-antigen ligase